MHIDYFETACSAISVIFSALSFTNTDDDESGIPGNSLCDKSFFFLLIFPEELNVMQFVLRPLHTGKFPLKQYEIAMLVSFKFLLTNIKRRWSNEISEMTFLSP